MRKGFTCGAFDLLHAGHIVMLKEAKENTNIFTKEDKINRALNNFLHKFGEK